MSREDDLRIKRLEGRLEQFTKMSCIYRARRGDVCLKDNPIREMLGEIDTLQAALTERERDVATITAANKLNAEAVESWKTRAETAEAKLEAEAVQ